MHVITIIRILNPVEDMRTDDTCHEYVVEHLDAVLPAIPKTAALSLAPNHFDP